MGPGYCYQIVKKLVCEFGANCDITFEVHKKLGHFLIESEPSLRINGHIHEIFSTKIEKLIGIANAT